VSRLEVSSQVLVDLDQPQRCPSLPRQLKVLRRRTSSSQDHAGSRRITQDHAGSRRITQDHLLQDVVNDGQQPSGELCLRSLGVLGEDLQAAAPLALQRLAQDGLGPVAA
jgi:hypothetical protein